MSVTWLCMDHCMQNQWKPFEGAYWCMCNMTDTEIDVSMRYYNGTGNCPGSGDEHHTIHYSLPEIFTFGAEHYKVSYLAIDRDDHCVKVDIQKIIPGLPILTKPIISSIQLNDGMLYNVGDSISWNCSITNTGDAGTVILETGIGYEDADRNVFYTSKGSLQTANLPKGFGEMFTGNLNVNIESFYRQEGTGWGYIPETMKVYFFAGHIEDGKEIWDLSDALNIVISHPEDYNDPTDPPLDDWELPIIPISDPPINDPIVDDSPYLGPGYGEDTLTEADSMANMALEMMVGLRPTDLAYDLNGNGFIDTGDVSLLKQGGSLVNPSSLPEQNDNLIYIVIIGFIGLISIMLYTSR